MDEVEKSLLTAWQRIAPRLLCDPTELDRRLARRSSALLTHPPRTWCIAIRASDTRLASFTLSPPHPATPSSHTVFLDSQALRKLTAPVHIDKPGEPLIDVAKKLGTTPHGLLDARLAGVFRTHHIPSRFGKPTPLLYTDRPLDPCARSFAQADCAWSATIASALDRVPDGIDQTLTRVPVYQNTQPFDVDRDPESLHPEHPANDRPLRRKQSRKLPEPQPDYVWYKWSQSGHFLGTDPTNWRKSPSDPGDRPRRDKQKRNRPARQGKAQCTHEAPPCAAAPQKSKNPADQSDMTEQDWQNWQSTGQPQTPESEADLAELLKKQDAIFATGSDDTSGVNAKEFPNPKSPIQNPKSSSGSLKFRGYRWQCPACGRKVNLLFYPLPRLTCLDLPKLSRPRRQDDEQEVNAPLNTFACEKCHGLRRQSRTDPNAWNEIVTYLSAGLLYGKEVERPKWFPKPKRADRAVHMDFSIQNPQSKIQNRKLPYVPRPNRAPSQRRPQIEKLLLEGKTFKQIAIQLQLVYGTVLWYARQIYKQHNVHNVNDFLKKHGKPTTESPTKQIRERLRAGESIAQIAAELNVEKMVIYNQRQALRKKGFKLPETREHNRVGAASHACASTSAQRDKIQSTVKI